MIDAGEGEGLPHGPVAIALELLLRDHRDLRAVEALEVGLKLHPVPRAGHVGLIAAGQRLLHRPRLVAGTDRVAPVREDPGDRVPDHVDQLRVGYVLGGSAPALR